jgi:hypothetical protein
LTVLACGDHGEISLMFGDPPGVAPSSSVVLDCVCRDARGDRAVGLLEAGTLSCQVLVFTDARDGRRCTRQLDRLPAQVFRLSSGRRWTAGLAGGSSLSLELAEQRGSAFELDRVEPSGKVHRRWPARSTEPEPLAIGCEVLEVSPRPAGVLPAERSNPGADLR